MGQIEDKAWELMVDGYDLHVHSAPSAFPRALDSWELVHEASQAGMAGVLLKSHYESTAIRAELINRHINCKTKAYGGLALNWPVGGLNVYAVENALKVGAKVIWMPTRDSANSLRYGNMDGDFFSRKGICILDENEQLKASVFEILDTVKKHGATLATGHLSPKESILLCRVGRSRGVRMILTHPEFSRTKVPVEIQKGLADEGVLIEKNWLNVIQGTISIEEMAQTIRQVGCGRTFIATDRGQKGAPHPTSELHRFICALLEQGLTGSQIRDMVCSVPKSIVD